jgi:hypothetical protein
LPGTSAAPYLGSESSTPIVAHCAVVLENQRRNFPEAYRLVTLGVGLDGIGVPALDTLRLRPRDETGALTAWPEPSLDTGAGSALVA